MKNSGSGAKRFFRLGVWIMVTQLIVACTQSTTESQVQPKTKVKSAQEKSALVSELSDYRVRDIRDEVVYFVLPDRFDNGDPDNDLGSKIIAASAGGFDPTSTGHYHGGDLRGLINRLDYLKGMGITAIWLTPILRNQAVQGDSAGYHGYWPLDFTEIDPHLGSNQELKEFIRVAHEKNIKVFFDIITNHTADVIKYQECHTPGKPMFSTEGPLCEYRSLQQVADGDGYTPFLPEGSEKLKVPEWLNDPKYYHNQGDTTWTGENSVYGDFAGLDDIDTDNPEVVRGMIEIFNNLISEFKPDGFRIDTVKHVNIEFWQQFTPAITQHAQSIGIENFFVFGEVYSGDPKLLSYYTTVGDMPSVLDFAFQFRTRDVIVAQKGTDNLADLFSHDSLYLDDNSDASLLMNFVSNHDVGRLGHALEQYDPTMSDDEKLKRMQLANALMFFARGIPVIYYGDEQGFTGDGGDRGAREDMMPSKTPSYNDNNLIGTDATTAEENFDTEHPLYQSFRSYAAIYQRFEALRKGEQSVLHAEAKPGVFAMLRQLNDEKLLVVFNTATTKQTFKHQALVKSEGLVFQSDAYIKLASSDTVALSPLSFAIVKIKP